MCVRCEELEEENAWLKSELGIQQDVSRIMKLHKAMLASPAITTSGRRGAAEFVSALYGAKGRVMTHAQLLESVPSRDREDRAPGITTVWAYVARCALGKDIIQTVFGRGYQLTPKGMKLVTAMLK